MRHCIPSARLSLFFLLQGQARARPFWSAPSSADNSSDDATGSAPAPPPLLLPLSFDFSAGDPTAALDTLHRTSGTPGSSTGAPMGPTSAPAVSFPCSTPQQLPSGAVLQLRSSQGVESNVRSLGEWRKREKKEKKNIKKKKKIALSCSHQGHVVA